MSSQGQPVAHLGTTPPPLQAVGPTLAHRTGELGARVARATAEVYEWMAARDFAGYDPFDLTNSPYLRGRWTWRFPFNLIIRQFGTRFSGTRTRRWLRVPPSRNPKAVGLLLAGCCDASRNSTDRTGAATYFKSELRRLRSDNEEDFCWGYDWDSIALRGAALPAFKPHVIATTFCGNALLDMADAFGDEEAEQMAVSAAQFIVKRLNRSVDTATELCFSYTPWDRTRIYNASALAASFLTRCALRTNRHEYLALARRAMRYLVNQQLPDGSWRYGAGRWQRWVDNFHTGYNLTALLAYRNLTGDDSVNAALTRGYDFCVSRFFTVEGAPRYFANRTYPIDIHACSQAILTFCDFASEREGALELAVRSARWTLDHMRAPDGSFYYRRHRLWTNRMPYMRWGQAWMFRALARLQCVLQQAPQATQ